MLSCDAAQRSLSAVADGEAPDAPVAEVDQHVAGCDECRRFDARVREVRQLLRLEPVGDLPDVAPAVLARVAAGARRRWWPSVAAAALVGAVAGASFAGAGGEPDTVAAADLPEAVVDAQRAITSLAADVDVVAGTSTWEGTLTYRAPESLAVVLRDEDDRLLATVADDDDYWTAGPRRCAPPAVSPCAPPTVRAMEGRAPFADGAPVPLELIAPVDALSRSAPLTELGVRTIDDRRAVGVQVTAGQVDALLSGFDPTGALPPVHPTDVVDLWLDAAHLVPLEVVVRGADTPARARWAAGLGLRDEAGAVVREMRLSAVALDGLISPVDFPPPPTGADVTDAGFRSSEPDVPTADVPAGFGRGRTGTVGDVGVRTWSDGRAWIAVRATRSWVGGRLFGDLGDAVVPIDLGAGRAYMSGDGTRIGIHGDGIDVVVAGTVGPDELRAVAASLGLVGAEVPPDWAESATATLDEAMVAMPDLLFVSPLDGFGEPAVRIADGDVALRYVGAGARSFTVVSGVAAQLPPPLDPDVTAVTVRDVAGRWRAATGDLEWVEDGRVRAIRSTTIPLAELLAIAEDLRRRVK